MRKCLLLLFALGLVLPASSAFATNFCVNPGFEDGTGNAAPPWSFWGGTGGALANPFVDANNPSPRCWSNFGNPTYVNVAAQNNMSGVWLAPGATYRVRAQYYVPSSEVLPGITPRAGIYLSMMTAGTFRVLDPRYPEANVPPAPTADIPVTDAWYTIDYNWVYPSATYDQMNYMSFRLYGGDGTTIPVSNPGGYFDNCQFSSAVDYYTPTFTGVVKDSATGLGIVGANVTIKDSIGATPVIVLTTTTGAGGAYSVPYPNALPPGMPFTVDATAGLYTSDGAQAFTITGASPAIPAVTMTRVAITVHISGTVTGPGGPMVGVKVNFVSPSVSTSTTTLSGGAYSIEVAPDAYTVSCSQFPLTAPAQIAYTFDLGGNPIDVSGLDFALSDSSLVWYKFDGNCTDSSGNGKDGTLAGAAAFKAGRVGQCLDTTAGHGGVTVPMLGAASGDAPLLNAYTMTAWVRCTTQAEWQTLYADPGWEVNDVNNPIFSQSNQMLCSVNGTDGTDHWYPAPWTLSQWHFVSIVYDSVAATESFYFDGAKVRTDTFTIALPVHWEANAGIACYGTDVNNRPFTGQIDDFRILSVAASDADIAALYASYPAAVWHTITTSTDGGATITPSGPVSVMDGYDQSFTITANLGYGVTKVLVDTVEQLPIPTSYTFTNVTTDHAISVQTILLPTQSISGKVTDKDGVAIGGASVYFSGTPSASVAPFVTAITNPDGTYIQTGVPQGTVYVSAGNVAGKWNSPDKVVVVDADKTGVDFKLLSNTRNIPAQSDLFFSVLTDSLPDTNGALTGNWTRSDPAGGVLNTIADPRVGYVDNIKWEANRRSDAIGNTGYELLGYEAGGIVCDGVTIVAVASPQSISGDDNRGEIVSLYYNKLTLCVQHSTGQVLVSRQAWDWQATGCIIPDGQKTILSLVVQPNGAAQLFANGVSAWTSGPTGDFTVLGPPDAWMTRIGVGRNPWDGWSSFNGHIGDVFVYKTALIQSDRIALESDLGTKFGITTPVYHWITASADAGSTITPSGLVGVVDGASQTFTIAPLLGYALDSVLVDGVVQTPIPTSYTFTGVVVDHTISVTSRLAPIASVSGKVVDQNGIGIGSASVYFSGTPNASLTPILTATTNPDGTYIQTGVPQGTIYVSASAAGKWNSPDKVIALTGNVTGVNFQLFPTTRNIPSQSDLLFAAVTEALPTTNGAATGAWTRFDPAGGTLSTIGTPTVQYVGNLPWEQNINTEGDGYLMSRYAIAIPVSGASIVVVAKPTRGVWGEPWVSIVDVFYDRLCVGIKTDNGVVCAKRNVNTNNTTDNSPAVIPEGQPTILSMVVNLDGSYKLRVNGLPVMTRLGTGVNFDTLNPDHTATFGSDPDYTHYINFGRNAPDGWPTFNGNLGDVFVYTKAISDADLGTLETDLSRKFGISLAAPLPTVTNIAAVKALSDGATVTFAGPVSVTYAPRRGGTRRGTFIYVGEKQGLGGLRLMTNGTDTLNLGDTIGNLVGTYHKPAGAEPYFSLIGPPVGAPGIPILALGMNNKSAITDAKTQTNLVRVWGKASGTTTTGSGAAMRATAFSITDGYGALIPVSCTNIDAPVTAVTDINGHMVAVTGIATKDGSGKLIVYAQNMQITP